MTGRRHRVLVLVIALVAALASRPTAANAVTRACGDDARANTQQVLCASGSCTATAVRVTTAIEIPSGGCEFDLEGRSLSIERNIQLSGLGYFLVNHAGSITITSTGRVKARGDFVKPNGFVIGGGLVALVSGGTIDVAGGFDVSGDSAGTIRLDAQQDVFFRSGSSVTANGISATADEGEKYADGGSLEILARTGSVTISGDLALSGANQAQGGLLDVTAARDVTITRSLDLTGGGSDGGELSVSAGDHITIRAGVDCRSRVGGGYGGTINLTAGEDGLGGVVAGGMIDVEGASFNLQGSATDTFGGDGGELDVASYGRVRFFGAGVTIRADAATNFDGSGGMITIDSSDDDPNVLGPTDGDVQLGGVITLRSGSTGGDGGVVSVTAGRDLVASASIDAGGTDTGGDLSADAGRTLTVSGTMSAQALSAGGEGGYVELIAGVASDEGGLGTLAIQRDVLASGGSANAGGQPMSFIGCGLTVAGNVKLDGSAGTDANRRLGGADLTLASRRPMQLGAGSRYLAGPGGSITTVHAAGAAPILGAGVVFNPSRQDQTIAEGPYPGCAVCGDGRRQQGEVCDRGAAADGACCNASCTAFLCPTPTPTVTATPVRTSTPARTPTPVGMPTATPASVTTATATAALPSPTATVPAATTTPLPNSTPTVTTVATTATATSVPVASATATASATSLPSATVTPSPIATSVPTASPTAGTARLDHYQCYVATSAPGTPALGRRPIFLDDGREQKAFTAVRTRELCLPVDVNGRAIADPAATLQCFAIRDAAGEPRFRSQDVTIDDAFGSGRRMALRRAERLCLPAVRDDVPPTVQLDDFKCYTARPASGAARFVPRDIAVVDALGAGLLTVRKPVGICANAARDGGPYPDAAKALHCYEVRRGAGQPRFVSRTVRVRSAFGDEQLVLRKPTRLCLGIGGAAAPLPVCGDGNVDPDEQCDDGNAVDGDGCTAACRLERCGNGVRDPGEACDAGAANGTDECCDAACRVVDPDEDGICTRDDSCPDDVDNDGDGDGYCAGPTFRPPAVGATDPCSRRGDDATWTSAKLVVSRLDRLPGEQKVELKGAFTLPRGAAPFDPVRFGLRIRIADRTGTMVLDETLPAGPKSAARPSGWKASGKPAAIFTFTDPGRRYGGLAKVVVRDRSAKLPGRVEITVVGKGGDYRVPTAGDLLIAVATDPTAVPPGGTPGVDRCGETRFPLASGECRLQRGTLRCQR